MSKKRIYLQVIGLLLAFAVPIIGAAPSSEALYNQARDKYQKFWTDEIAKGNRANWLEIISDFEKVYNTYPNSSSAPKAYYMAGKMSFYAYKYHRNNADFGRGVKNFSQLTRRFPNDSLADDAYYYLGELHLKAGRTKDAAYYYRKTIEKYPDGDMNRDARQRLEQMHLWPMPDWLRGYTPGGGQADASAGGPPEAPPGPDPLPENKPRTDKPQLAPEATSSGRVLVKDIKYFSSGSYTRVVIYCKEKVKYGDLNFIPPDPANGVDYPRMFIDVSDTRLSPGVGRPKIVNDGLLRRVRAGQNCPNVVRVVLDIDSIDKDHVRVIPMEESDGDFRIVIDVPGRKPAPRTGPPVIADDTPPEPEDHTVRKIVLDPGHGGKDPGAVGKSGLMEKNVVLKLSQKTAAAIRKKSGIEVLLTRNEDIYLSLEERTAYANVVGADIFVSIHVNAHPNEDARGIETYLLDTTNDRSAMRLAAVENRVSLDQLDDFQKDPLLFTLFQKAKADESYQLAKVTQEVIIEGLRKKYKNIFDHGVKEAPFFVLMGATMPCVLVESFFISNPAEEKRLANDKFLDTLADSMADGLIEYARQRGRGPVNDM